jgi:hypothetical protein
MPATFYWTRDRHLALAAVEAGELYLRRRSGRLRGARLVDGSAVGLGVAEGRAVVALQRAHLVDTITASDVRGDVRQLILTGEGRRQLERWRLRYTEVR